MPSGQFYVVDQPELNFTASYHIDKVNEPSADSASRMVLEIQKRIQSTEAFDALSIGNEVTFVSSAARRKRWFW
ncbi:hypothetical protein ACLHDD_04205 [Pantoea sp. NSTU24]|uniref:hypothetical protein n=1 Tax=Pantoea sp. NSTU24 TaxID=3391144 RepID=UPI003D04FE67